jgi:DNA-binding SARP family transcriptional activator
VIYLHTLGDTLIKVGEKEIRPTSPLLFAALLYLGIERGRRVPRAALQELFFPNADERSGAHSLRQLLYKLRQLGAPISATTDYVIVESDVVCDDTALVRSADEYLQRRRFLPIYAPKISDAFTDWLDSQRAITEAEVRRGIVDALGRARTGSDWRRVEAYSLAILELDPLHEEATLALAEATALAGSKSAAIQILDQYATETGNSTLTLPATVLRRRISERSDGRNHISTVLPFVGRGEVVRAVQEEINRAACNVSRLLLIAGQAGVGKSRLLSEVVDRLGFDGVSTAVVRCRLSHARRALGVLVELVPMLQKLPGALGISPNSYEYLRTLVNHAGGKLEPPVNSRDTSTRVALIGAAFRDLVDAIASEQPIVLIVEDAHWADEESIEQLVQFLEGYEKPGLTLIVSTRTPIRELQKPSLADCATQIDLAPLDDGAMRELANFLLQRSGRGVDVVDWCVRTAEGNPLYLQLLCEDYARVGQAFRVPDTIKELIGKRIQGLSERSRRILEFCALLGPHCTVDALTKISDLGRAALVTGVLDLEQQSLLKMDGEKVRVSHDLVASRAVSMLPPITRKLLHMSTASILQERYDATGDATLMWDCAEQWFLSDQRSNAMSFLRKCAHHAADLAQPTAALELLAKAEALAGSDEERIAIYEDTMLVARSVDRFPVIHKAAQRIHRLRRQDAPTHDTYELLAIEALWERSYRASDVVTSLSHCVGSTDAATDHRLSAAWLLLRVAHECNLPDLARDVFDIVRPLFEKSDNYARWIAPLIYHTSFGDHRQALALARSIRIEMYKWASVSQRLRVGFNVAIAFSFLGQCQESESLHAELYEEAAALRLNEWQLELSTSACWHFLDIEDVHHAFAWYEKSERLITSMPVGKLLLRRHVAARSELALLKGDSNSAVTAFAELVSIGSGDSMRVALHVETFMTRLRLVDPEYECSESELAALLSWYERSRMINEGASVVTALADALLRAGRRDEARKFVEDYLRLHRPEGVPSTHSLHRIVKELSASVSAG